MFSIYYKIWADAIAHERAKKNRRGSWQAATIISISLLQGINLLTVLLFIRLISHNTYPVIFPLHLFNRAGMNTFCSLALTYFIPFVIINYLLIFYAHQYDDVLKTYGDKNGKLYRTYTLVSVGIIIIPYLIKLVLF
jgi:hypothetical protein